MQAAVEKFIERAKQKEEKNKQKQRAVLLSKLGFNVRNITDEEYEEIRKYAHLYTATFDESEEKLRFIATIILIISIIGAIICITSGITELNNILISVGVVAFMWGIVQYYFIQIFTKISQRISNIEKKLIDKCE